MGSHNFEDTVYEIDDMRAAYTAACEAATYNHGQDPYNGTIATTGGVQLSPLSRGGKVVREDEVDQKALGERLDHLSKWGNCEAIRIQAVKEAVYERMGRLSIEVSIPTEVLAREATHHGEFTKALHEAAMKNVAAQVRRKGSVTLSRSSGFGQPIMDVEVAITAGRAPKDFHSVNPPHLAALRLWSLSKVGGIGRSSTTTQATPGKAETRYFVISAGKQMMPAWEEGHPTQAAARAVLPTKLLESRATVNRYEIVGMTRRASGEGLVSHEVNLPVSKTVKVRVVGDLVRCTAPSVPLDRYGWLFYGWAAS